MSKVYAVLKHTSLALATGLFTGAVVASIITDDYPYEILRDGLVPALVFYDAYIMLWVVESEKQSKKKLVLSKIFFLMLIAFLFLRLLI